MKVYVHTVCIKSESTFVSNMFNSLPALPSIGGSLAERAAARGDRLARRHAEAEAQAQSQGASLPAAGYTGVVSGLPNDIPSTNAPTLGASGSRLGRGAGSGSPAVLEAAKQSGAADVRPVLASIAMAAAAVALML